MRQQKPPQPTKITIAIVGDGITPRDVSLRQLSQLLEAMASTVEAVAAENQVDPPKISLSQVKEGSAAYDLVSEDRRSTRVIRSFEKAARRRGKGSSPRTRSALTRLQKVASQAGAGLRIEPAGKGADAKVIYLAAPIPEEDTQIEEGTTVFGRLVGLRLDARDQAAVTFRYDDGGHGEFSATPELMTRAAALLGAHVAAKVTFIRGEQRDWEGAVESIEERPGVSDFMETIREARSMLAEQRIIVDAAAWLADDKAEREEEGL